MDAAAVGWRQRRAVRGALAFAQAARGRFVRELAQFVRFDSVSADPARRERVAQCAAWLAAHLRGVGLERVRVVPTAGHPIVVAETLRGPPRPTLLLYGHYDVQPAQPDEAWSVPPFGAQIRGDRLVGRGASDDKGQLWAHVKAIECFLRTSGALPLRLKCVFDGEEEIGSAQLLRHLAAHAGEFAADAAIVSDMPMRTPGRPALTEAMRGVLRIDVDVQGAPADLHSGLFGGVVDNPAQVLCRLLAGLHTRDGRIALPGFYDRVRAASAAERAYMARVGPAAGEMLQAAGVAQGAGEAGFTPYERSAIRPALSVTRIAAGNGGTGAKAVIPARAAATLDFRLVPGQDPRQIAETLRVHLAAAAPPTVRIRITTAMAAAPFTASRSGPAAEAAAAALCLSFGAAPAFIRLGGTVPVLQWLQHRRIPTVLMGLALPDDRMHAPDEGLYLPNLHRGIAASIRFMSMFARSFALRQGAAR